MLYQCDKEKNINCNGRGRLCHLCNGTTDKRYALNVEIIEEKETEEKKPTKAKAKPKKKRDNGEKLGD